MPARHGRKAVHKIVQQNGYLNDPCTVTQVDMPKGMRENSQSPIPS